jgi:hypothetical protein
VDALTTLLALFAAAAAALALLLAIALRSRMRRIGVLENENEALREQDGRMALLERREAVCAPLDLLSLCWKRCVPPDEEIIHNASAAAEAAKRLFPADLEPDLDEIARRLAALAEQRARQRDAVLAGRHGERIALMEEEADIERVLKPKLAALGTLLADAVRPVGRDCGSRG